MSLDERSHRRNSRLYVVALWVALIALDTSAQLLFKSAAVRLPPAEPSSQWLYQVAHSLRFWAAALCLVMTFAATALTFVGVIGGSVLVFGESVSAIQYAGIALIVVGVALLGRLDR